MRTIITIKKLLNIIPTAIALSILYLGLHNLTPSKAFETCAVVKSSVHDGDTMRVTCKTQQTKIRFACIDAPEIKQENGIASRNHLRTATRICEADRFSINLTIKSASNLQIRINTGVLSQRFTPMVN